MGFFGNLTMRRYAATNLILGAMFINLLLFGGRLEMGEAFTAGLATGLGVGWLAFGIGGWIALKRPGRTWDERTATINMKASAISFCVVMLVTALMSAALRSRTLGMDWSAADLAGMLVNLGLASFGLSALVIRKRT
ncbi:MAG TPA: hypothetical protein PLW80_07730 [Spirochaetales bacterium]|nr:hypothetical protein [Spirochaetales bacterium]HPG86736.1 hypothetical protein [Spirochaetales bacterium]HQO65609.1 hypothetical protein [Spirochaetales bacterium]